jgi:multidrug efflux pump subunit AcrB
MVTVSASLPGAAPAQMETEVARKIENSVATLQGVKHIYTKVQDGTATVTVEFRLEKPTQEAVDDVRDAVSRVRSDLPGDLRDPVISKMVTLAGSADPDLHRGLQPHGRRGAVLVRRQHRDQGPAQRARRRRGGPRRRRHREVRVELDPARLLALRATAADISRQLRQMQQEASGGRADVGGIEQSVRTIATVQSAEELARSRSPSDGRRVRLDQLATCQRHGRRAALGRAARRQAGGRLRDHAQRAAPARSSRGEGVRAALAKLQAAHPDITITEAFNFVDPVVENFEGSMCC